jgi:hypothetical protein
MGIVYAAATLPGEKTNVFSRMNSKGFLTHGDAVVTIIYRGFTGSQ